MSERLSNGTGGLLVSMATGKREGTSSPQMHLPKESVGLRLVAPLFADRQYCVRVEGPAWGRGV